MISKVRWVLKFVRKNGVFSFIQHYLNVKCHTEEKDYNWWRKRCSLRERRLEIRDITRFKEKPLISLLVFLDYNEINNVKKLIKIIQSQTYENWELYLIDRNERRETKDSILSEKMKMDKRIKLFEIDSHLSVVGSINCALRNVTGEFVSLINCTDLIETNTLYEFVKAINRCPEIDFLYSDEDMISEDGKKYFFPHFKSDYNIDLLRSVNYIGHMFLVRRRLQNKAGMLCEDLYKEYEYDFILRCVEKCEIVEHIPQILYHKRVINSTVNNLKNSDDEKLKVISMHLNRCGLKGYVNTVANSEICRIRYLVENQPLISIIIPNMDHIEDLKRCIKSLFEISEYYNFEIIIVENRSVEKKTFAYYKDLLNRYKNVKILVWSKNDVFNYSALNNFGVKCSRGKYILFLNNDTEIINKDCISEMVSHIVRKEVGGVGARLYYPDGSIQHAGVILGLGGIAGHAFRGEEHYSKGYFSRIQCTQNYSAVTAACMMVSKELFEKVGGFDEKLKVAFNDIDLCMKIRKQGKLIVYTPYAELYHYESKSRGLEDTEEKIQRFRGEVQYFEKKWKKELETGDPYYNPNLTLEKSDFSLRFV